MPVEDYIQYEDNSNTSDDRYSTVCCFPGQCLMPGEHFAHECITAEMMEEFLEGERER